MSGAFRVHVVGAGMAGLAASIELAASGIPVRLYEAAMHAGGRCRSFYDSELGVRIDNGNHLLLSGNTAALNYIQRIGGSSAFEEMTDAAILFVDLETAERWSVRPSRGRIPWWLMRATRRVPGTGWGDYLPALRLARAPPTATVADILSPETALFRRLWQPLTVAALNTEPKDASAVLLWRILAETLGRGATACRPLVARHGLSEGLVDPAIACLAKTGAEIRFGLRLRSLELDAGQVSALLFDGERVTLGPGDSVILAVPAGQAARLVPGLVVPDDHAPIVNAHFRLAPPAEAPALLGLVGGVAEWVFRKPEVISVTVSAADRLVDTPADVLRDLLWRDVARALRVGSDRVPPARIVKERRATFRATPAQAARRPGAVTRWNNLHLAGDYVDTGLPATIEGAIRSGYAAAARVHRRREVWPVPRLDKKRPAPALAPEEDCQRAVP